MLGDLCTAVANAMRFHSLPRHLRQEFFRRYIMMIAEAAKGSELGVE